MSILSNYLLIFIVPVTVFVMSCWFRAASGPFWLFADPCYFYLFNALYLVRGEPPANVCHPGTPLQVLIYILIRIFNLGHSVSATVNNVLLSPEFYLYATFVVLLAGAFISSVLLAIYVYRRTNDVIASILIQLPGLCFLIWPSINAAYPVLPIVANVSPEPLFLTITNIFNLFFLRLYFTRNSANELTNVLLLAFIAGLGLATKLNFFPVLLSAIIILNWHEKITFILACGAFFVLWTLPIISKYPMIWYQIKQASLYTSRYGWGTATVINPKMYFQYFNYMVLHYWFFILSALFMLIWSLIHLINDKKDRTLNFLAASSTSCILQFVVTAKFFSYHYLVPAIGLFGAVFLLFYLHLGIKFKNVRNMAILFISIFVMVCFYFTVSYHHKLSGLTNDIRTVKSRIQSKYPDGSLLTTWTTDINIYLSQEQALFMGNAISFNKESEDLYRLYPHFHYFFSEPVNTETFGYGIWDFKKRVYADDLLKINPINIFLEYGSGMDAYPFQTVLIDHSKYLNAYLLSGSNEKLADDLFAEARIFYGNHDYPKAFLYALKSRQLNFQPKGEIEYFLATLYHQMNGK